jgi:anti-sigma factor RsiW
MKKDCAKYREQLLEAAMTGSAGSVLELHLQNCADCTTELAELRARRERLDTLLPLLVRGAEPATEFRAQVLAAAEAASKQERSHHWRVWVLAGVTAAIATALMAGWILEQRASRLATENEMAAAEKLAQWRAPSDVLLEIPGQEILRATPRLGESYLKVEAKKNEEE